MLTAQEMPYRQHSQTPLLEVKLATALQRDRNEAARPTDESGRARVGRGLIVKSFVTSGGPKRAASVRRTAPRCLAWRWKAFVLRIEAFAYMRLCCADLWGGGCQCPLRCSALSIWLG